MRLILLKFAVGLSLSVLLASAAARPGYVQTRDGRTVEGNLVLTNGAFLVGTTDSEGTHWIEIPLTNLSALRFEARPPGSSVPAGKGNGLLGYYFSTTNATGPVVVRLDQTVNFDWGAAAPARGVSNEIFSVIWTGELEAPSSGPFTFYLEVDDGGRLFLQDKLVCEQRERQPAAETSGTVPLEGGRRYPLRLEMFDLFGAARARFLWTGPDTPKDVVPKHRLYAVSHLPGHRAQISGERGLLATYYSGSDWTGDTYTRIEPTIDLAGNEGSPASLFSPNNYSVRWSGQVVAPATEVVTFQLISDEPARLYLGPSLYLNQTMDSYAEQLALIPMKEGERYDLQVETRNTRGGLVARLLWQGMDRPRAAIGITNLFPSRSVAPGNLSLEGAIAMPAGVLLRDGTFLAGPIEQATESAVHLDGRFHDVALSTVNVAAMFLQGLPQSLVQRHAASRPGVFLAQGEFIEADFRGLKEGRLEMTSTLFGRRSYEAGREAMAVSLRPVVAAPAAFEVRLRDYSVLQAHAIEVTASGLTVRQKLLGELKLREDEIVSVQMRGRGPVNEQ
jgi:hypothetical protein